MLTIAVLLLAALFGSAAAQTTSCVNAGYDLTSITGQDLFINGTGKAAGVSDTLYQWAVRPCGYVSTPVFCTDMAGEFCQGGTTVSTMNVSGTGVGSGAIWGQIQLNGQYGVAQFLQDGTSCGSDVGDREGTIVYLCNATATTPYISSLLELSTCNYQVVIQTAAICSQRPSTGFSTSVGTTIISNSCGGGIYDLSSINGADIIGTAGGNTWAIRPCGNVAVQNCSGASANTSICQYGSNAGGLYGYAAAEWLPGKSNTFYQYVAPGVLNQVMQDGGACGAQERYTNVTYVCSASATTPVLVSASEPKTCEYYLTVQTAAVCGTAFAQLLGGSSTGGVVGQSSAAYVSSVSSGSATIPVQTAATSVPGSNPSNGAAASPASLLVVVACALLALVMA